MDYLQLPHMRYPILRYHNIKIKEEDEMETARESEARTKVACSWWKSPDEINNIY